MALSAMCYRHVHNHHAVIIRETANCIHSSIDRDLIAISTTILRYTRALITRMELFRKRK